MALRIQAKTQSQLNQLEQIAAYAAWLDATASIRRAGRSIRVPEEMREYFCVRDKVDKHGYLLSSGGK